MEKTELRIGNIVSGGTILELHSTYAVISGGSISGYHGEDYSEITPIEITKDWLHRLGFENKSTYRGDGSRPYFNHPDIDFSNEYDIYIENFSVLGHDDNDREIASGIKYIHQLQNLFFALTGKELIAK